MEIVAMNEELKPIAHHFLDVLDGCVVEEDILSNASVIIDQKQIVGMMSYEAFGCIGLIRYFIFQKSLNPSLTIELLNHVIQHAKLHHIEQLIGIVSSEEVEEVFILLGFHELSKENVYIDETIFSHTAYKDSKIYGIQL